MTVDNVVEAASFLKKHFGYRDMFEDNNAGMAVLEDGSGLCVSLMKGSNASYPKYFHVGFDVKTEDNVNTFHQKLVADGLKIDPPEHEAWGSYTFNFKIPGGDFTIEVACATGDWA